MENKKKDKNYHKTCDLVVLGNIAGDGIEVLVKEKKKELISYFSNFYIDIINNNIKKEKDCLKTIYSLIGLELDIYKNIVSKINKEIMQEILKYVDKRNHNNKQIPNHQFIDREESLAIFNIHKGGILTCLHIITESFDCGLRYDMSKIPIKQEYVEVCDFFRINAYRLKTNEVYIYCVNDYYNFKNTLLRVIEKRIGKKKDLISINEYIDKYMVCIGELNNQNDKIRIDSEGESFLEKSYKDELEKIESINIC